MGKREELDLRDELVLKKVLRYEKIEAWTTGVLKSDEKRESL